MPPADSKRCSRCGRRTGATSKGPDVCRSCMYAAYLPMLVDRDLPVAPVGERYAALTDVAPYWAVARYVGADSRIVRRQALLYRSSLARSAEVELARPNPQYVKRCGICGQPRHLSPTCPELRPDRNED